MTSRRISIISSMSLWPMHVFKGATWTLWDLSSKRRVLPVLGMFKSSANGCFNEFGGSFLWVP